MRIYNFQYLFSSLTVFFLQLRHISCQNFSGTFYFQVMVMLRIFGFAINGSKQVKISFATCSNNLPGSHLHALYSREFLLFRSNYQQEMLVGINIKIFMLSPHPVLFPCVLKPTHELRCRNWQRSLKELQPYNPCFGRLQQYA